MATAAELLQAYREQAGLDADETMAVLLEFLAGFGMTGTALGALCERIDDEGLTEDFAGLLKENGLVLDADEAPEEDDPID